jgi:hypothetical protein
MCAKSPGLTTWAFFVNRIPERLSNGRNWGADKSRPVTHKLTFSQRAGILRFGQPAHASPDRERRAIIVGCARAWTD